MKKTKKISSSMKEFIFLIISLLLHLILISFFLFFAFKETGKQVLEGIQKVVFIQEPPKPKQLPKPPPPQKKPEKKQAPPEKKPGEKAPPKKPKPKPKPKPEPPPSKLAALYPKFSKGGKQFVLNEGEEVKVVEKKIEEKKQPVKQEKQKVEAKPAIKKSIQPPKEKSQRDDILRKPMPKPLGKPWAKQEKPLPIKKPISIEKPLPAKKLLPVIKQPKKPKPIDMKRIALSKLVKQTPKDTTKGKEKKKSILSLTKCFLDHEKGNSCMLRDGEDRPPTLHEMKYLCYEKRIQDCIVSTWKTLYGLPEIETRTSTRFTFVINDKGRAEEVELVQSSGNGTFDQMVLRGVRETVFPPIPKHFGMTRYRPQGGYIFLR